MLGRQVGESSKAWPLFAALSLEVEKQEALTLTLALEEIRGNGVIL